MTSSSSSRAPSSTSKGKARAADVDFTDLNPVVTYRHLHADNLGVKDPLRVIALCDSDAFYAACEQVRLGIDPSIPLVVQQWDSLIAVNYPARKYGISRMDKVKEAKKRCPNLVAVHVATYKEGEKEPGYWQNPDTLTHKVSLDHYRRESAKIIQTFKESLPGAEIERASIDEAFIDLTRPVREELIKRYPYLAQIPFDAPDGRDSPLPPPPPISWEGLGTLVPVVPPPPDTSNTSDVLPDLRDRSHPYKTPIDEELGAGEDDESTTWHDVGLSIAAELMSNTRNIVHKKLGYTTSAGLARNKFLAKLAASYRKPMNQSIIRNAAIPNYLRPMPFQKIRFLGGKLGSALAKEYDVSIVGDLLSISLEEMQRKFGEGSIWVYEILRGIDRSEVKEKPATTKSMLASKNLPQPIVKTSQGHHWIRVLAAELALRLNEARDNDPALWPKSIVLHARQGYETGRSKQMPFPFTHDITVDTIASYGDKLWKDLVGTDDKRSTPMKITNVMLSFSGIDTMEAGQQIIEGFFKPHSAHKLVSSSPTSKASLKRKRGDSTPPAVHDLENDDSDANRTYGDQSEDLVPPAAVKDLGTSSSSRSSFICDRCKKRIALPEGFGNEADLGDDIMDEAIAALRLEHDDYHFAQDLEKQGNSPRQVIKPQDKKRKSPPRARKKNAPDVRSTEPETKGIARFFTKN